MRLLAYLLWVCFCRLCRRFMREESPYVPCPQYVRITMHISGSPAAEAAAAGLLAATISVHSNSEARKRQENPAALVSKQIHLWCIPPPTNTREACSAGLQITSTQTRKDQQQRNGCLNCCAESYATRQQLQRSDMLCLHHS